MRSCFKPTSATQILALLIIALMGGSAATAAAMNLVNNGSFELGTDPGVALQINAPNSSIITGWSVSAGDIDYYGSAWAAGDGARSLDMSGTSPGTITQNVTGFAVGYTYRLSFLMAGNPGAAPAIKRLRASIGTNAQEYSFDVTGHGYFTMGWTTKTLDFLATSSTMLLTFVSLTDGAGGPALDNASITLSTNTPVTNLPPTIVNQPQDLLAPEGSNATFSVVAASATPLTYQWRFGGGPIVDETNAVLNLLNVNPAQAGGYSVVVANAFGSITSVVVTLTVTNYATAIFDVSDFSSTTNPGAIWSYGWFGSVGGAFQLLPVAAAVNFSGATVQSWRYGNSAQPIVYWNGTTNTATSQGGQGVYPPGTVWVYTGADNTPQNFGAVRFTAPVGGASRYRLESSFLPLFSGPISGDTDIHIVKNGAEIFSQFLPSNTGAVYTNGIDFAPGDTVDFLVGRGQDGREYASGLKIAARFVPIATGSNLPPVILGQPRSVTALEGTNIAFNVLADGTPELAYQWLRNATVLPGATNSVLSLNGILLGDAGPYSVIVGNAFGAVTSQVATLTLTQAVASVWVVGGLAGGGGEINVPIRIRANGNENAISFSLSFNKTLLSVASTSLGAGAPAGSALLLNTNDLALGRIGLGVGLPADAVMARGTQEIVVVTFLVAPVINQVTTTISFGDQPTLRQLSDAHALVLPALYASGNVAIIDSQLEGDVAPRPGGNRSVTIVDWVQMGRFVALLDTIGGSNEFQRADCAPRAPKGNGVLGASDWVQVGRYAVGLDPITIAGGPTEPDLGGGGAFSTISSGTTLSLANTSIIQGQTNGVPVNAICMGPENALTFSVTFDPTKLAFVSATPGSAAGGATLNPNVSQLAAGHLGLALALQPGTSFGAGNREAVQLRFQALVNAPATSAVAFANSPLVCEISDVLASPMTASYVPATVTITPPPGPPIVASRSGNTLYLAWPSSATGFELEGSDGALGTSWTGIPAFTLGDQRIAIVSITGGQRYFRLKKP